MTRLPVMLVLRFDSSSEGQPVDQSTHAHPIAVTGGREARQDREFGSVLHFVFEGWLSDLRIYPRAITEGDILLDMYADQPSFAYHERLPLGFGFYNGTSENTLVIDHQPSRGTRVSTCISPRSAARPWARH